MNGHADKGLQVLKDVGLHLALLSLCVITAHSCEKRITACPGRRPVVWQRHPGWIFALAKQLMKAHAVLPACLPLQFLHFQRGLFICLNSIPFLGFWQGKQIDTLRTCSLKDRCDLLPWGGFRSWKLHPSLPLSSPRSPRELIRSCHRQRSITGYNCWGCCLKCLLQTMMRLECFS